MIETILDIIPELKQAESYKETWVAAGQTVWPLAPYPETMIMSLDSSLICLTREGIKTKLPGQSIGLDYFFDKNLPLYQVTTEESTRISAVSFSDLKKILHDHPNADYLQKIVFEKDLRNLKDYLLSFQMDQHQVRSIICRFQGQKSDLKHKKFMTFIQGKPVIRVGTNGYELCCEITDKDHSWIELLPKNEKDTQKKLISWNNFQQQMIKEVKKASKYNTPVFVFNLFLTLTLARLMTLQSQIAQSDLLRISLFLFSILFLTTYLEYLRQEKLTHIEQEQELKLMDFIKNLSDAKRSEWWFRFYHLHEQYRKIILHEMIPLSWTVLNTVLLVFSWINSEKLNPFLVILLVVLFFVMIFVAILRHIKLREQTEKSIQAFESDSWYLLESVLDFSVQGRIIELHEKLEHNIEQFWDSLKKQIKNTLSPLLVIDLTWISLLVVSIFITSRSNKVDAAIEMGAIIIGLEIIKSLQNISSSSFRIGDLIHIRKTIRMNWPEVKNNSLDVKYETFDSLEILEANATKNEHSWWWPSKSIKIHGGDHYCFYFSDPRARDLFKYILTGKRRSDKGSILLNGLAVSTEHRVMVENMIQIWSDVQDHNLKKGFLLFDGKQDELALDYFSKSYNHLRAMPEIHCTLLLTSRPEIAALADKVVSFHQT